MDNHLYLYRKYLANLREWKKGHPRKPLLLRGARQVGKSRLVSEFGKTDFKHFFVFDFEEDPSLKDLFRSDLKIDRILSVLEIRTATKFEPATTLLFFDEIQECPEAIAALRYFYEKAPDYHIIAAGSLLEFYLEKISFPVGRVDTLYMYPLNFEEFLLATDRKILAEQIPVVVDFSEKIKIDKHISNEIFKALNEYLIVGGMPAAASAFVASRSIVDVLKVQALLVRDFIDDTRKYARGNLQLENIATVLQRIPKMIGQEITYTTLGDSDNHQRTKKSLEMLSLALICTMVRSTSPASKTLSAKASEKHFKCLFLDVGLAAYLLGIRTHPSELSKSDKDVTSKLLEQFVGQELLTNSDESVYRFPELYCWIRPERTAKAEVDYIINRKGQIIPVEVKSGALGHMKSIKVLMAEYPSVKQGIILSQMLESEKSGNLLRLPIYVHL